MDPLKESINDHYQFTSSLVWLLQMPPQSGDKSCSTQRCWYSHSRNVTTPNAEKQQTLRQILVSLGTGIINVGCCKENYRQTSWISLGPKAPAACQAMHIQWSSIINQYNQQKDWPHNSCENRWNTVELQHRVTKPMECFGIRHLLVVPGLKRTYERNNTCIIYIYMQDIKQDCSIQE